MTKEEAKKQFDYHTKTLGLKHEFDFDEAWGWLEHQRAKKQGIAVVPSKEIVDQEYKYQFRENIMAFQDRVLAMENKPGVTLEREALDKPGLIKRCHVTILPCVYTNCNWSYYLLNRCGGNIDVFFHL